MREEIRITDKRVIEFFETFDFNLKKLVTELILFGFFIGLFIGFVLAKLLS